MIGEQMGGWLGGGFRYGIGGEGGVLDTGSPDWENRQSGEIARLGRSPDWEVRQIGNIPTDGQIGD